MGIEKKRTAIIIIILFISGISLITIPILLGLLKEDSPKLTESEKYVSLMEIASEVIYDGSYTKLPKEDKIDCYYMTFNEYKKKGYNLELVDASCPDDFKILIFKIDSADVYNSTYTINSCNEHKNQELNSFNGLALINLANEMYEDNSYLKLPKDSNDTYYMTIGEYKKRGYDISMIDSTCPDTFDFIHFDIRHKDDYEYNPIYISEDCKTISDNNQDNIIE